MEQKELKIAEERERAGGVSDFDVRSQRTLVAQTEAAIPPLELQLDTINDQLAVLMGLSPAEAHVEGISLDALHLPEELPLTVPSELVRQRPDIRAAEALLHEASANVGVATANEFPQIVLTGSGGGLGTRFNSGGDVWNVGAALAAPIFNGGDVAGGETQGGGRVRRGGERSIARQCWKVFAKWRMRCMRRSTMRRH